MIRATYKSGYFKEFFIIKDVTEPEDVVELRFSNVSKVSDMSRFINLRKLECKNSIFISISLRFHKKN